METLTIQIPDKDVKLFKAIIKKFKVKIIASEVGTEKQPNSETISAMNELKEGKGKKFGSVNELFDSI